MAVGSVPVWGIHAGAHGQADTLFETGVVAIGWNDTGDLSSIPNDREPFKQLVAQLYPQDKPGSWPVTAGMLYRFVHELKPGDLVVNRSKIHKQFRIGRITGSYVFKRDDIHAHQRAVTWLRTVDPAKLTQGARYEVGSAMSLFAIRNYADEWIALLDDPGRPPVEAGLQAVDDPTVAIVAEEIEVLTRDYVRSQLLEISRVIPSPISLHIFSISWATELEFLQRVPMVALTSSLIAMNLDSSRP